MIRLSCLGALALVLQAQQPAGEAAKPGAIRGTVTSVTGEPLRKAEVMLRSIGQRGPGGFSGRMGSMPVPMGGSEMPAVWAHTTDASGTFSFEQLPPGAYSLTVQRSGYVRTEYGSSGGQRGSSSTLTLAPGQEITGIGVKLTPHGVIAGKVIDEDGDPMMHTSVQVLRERWIQGKRQMVPMSADSTNDLGEYRIAGLMPGRYHLMVNYNRPDPYSRPRKPGQESDLGYASMFYPGTTDQQQAVVVTLAPAQELRGIDFQLRKVPTYRVRGKVIDESGATAQQVGVMAVPEGGNLYGGVRGMGMVRNGVFEISGLQPGNYTLVANGGGRGQARMFARQTVQIGARDVDGVVLALQPTFSVSGTVKAPETVSLSGARVFLDGMESGMPFGGGASSMVDGNSWRADNVSPGKFRFLVNPLPAGTYVKSVSVQGQDITSGAMISAAAAGIEIALGTGAPEVTGTVVNKDKEAAAGATVVLVPDTSTQEQFWLYRTTTADQNGSFALKNITPGAYTAYAFLDVEDGSWHSAEFMKQYDGKGVRLKLEENAREAAALTVAQ